MKILKPKIFELTYSNVPDSSYPVWNSDTSYDIDDIVYVPDTHGEYKALTANSGKYPPDNPTDWEWLGTTNRWKMFDQYLNTVTNNPDTIDIKVVSYAAEGVYIGNIKAAQVNLEIIDNSDGSVIESASYSLIRDITDWLDYFFGDWIDSMKTSFYYKRETLTNDVTFHITVDATGSTAEAGIFVIGDIAKIGDTIYEANVSALDYSKVVTDANTGVTYLSQGNYVKTAELDIFTRSDVVDVVYQNLIKVRGLPVVFVNEGNYETLTIYGFLKKFETVIKTPVHAMITASIQGLI